MFERKLITPRRLAMTGLMLGASAQALLIYAAARLRAVGSHDDLFSFHEVGLLQTGNDGITVIIVVLGTVSAGLACWKGYCGLSDPIPGFGDAWRDATVRIDGVADDIAEDGIEAVEDLSAEALDEAEEALEDAEDEPARLKDDFAVLADDISAHNNALEAAKGRVLAAAESLHRKADYVGNAKRKRFVAPDLSAFAALHIDPIDDDWTRFDPVDGDERSALANLFGELNAARAHAVSDIRAALAAYHADAPNLSILFDKGDDSDGTL